MSLAAIAEPLLVAAIRVGSVGPLLLISLAIMGSPGPATISLVAAGSAYGVRRSLSYLVGIIAGTTIVLVAVATGITAALLAVPRIGPVLIGISAVYILWLAFHIALAPPLSEPISAPRGFSLLGGLLLGVANPKAWVAIAAVFASTRLAHAATTDASAGRPPPPAITAIQWTNHWAGWDMHEAWPCCLIPMRSRWLDTSWTDSEASILSPPAATRHLPRSHTAKIALLTVMIIAMCASWLVAGASLARLLSDRRARVVNVGLAVALVGATALAVLH